MVSITDPDREYKKDNLRLNLNWRLGAHSIDAGIDNLGFTTVLPNDWVFGVRGTHRPFDGRWYSKMSYVWSHSYGTTEGQLRSDLWRTGGALGSYQGQAATSTTQSWDHAALMENCNGNQSNDCRHQLKAYGFYQLTEEWGTSANLSLISGPPRPCLGYYYGSNYDASDRDPAGYANSSITGGPYHFCYNPATGRGEASPLGSHGNLG